MFEAGVTLSIAEVRSGDQPHFALQPKSFEALIENHATASDTVQRFALDKPPYNLGPAEFLLRVARADQIEQTNLFRLTVRLPDAKLAAAVANDMANRVRDLTRKISTDQGEGIRELLGAQLSDARQRLDTVQADLERLKSDGQPDLLRRDVETLLLQRKDLRELTVKIAGERAWQASAEAALAKRQRVDVLTRSIDGDATLREAARQAGASNVLGLSLKNEFVNSVYDDIDTRLTQSRASLASMEQQRDELLRGSGLGADQLARLSQLYGLEARIQRREVDLELAKRVFLEIASSYEQVRAQVASRSAWLQIVDPALLPSKPQPRHVARNAVLGALAALVIGLSVLLLRGASAS